MEKNMKKQNDKKAEKGMNRTEFAQEYSLETNKQNSKQSGKNQKSNQKKDWGFGKGKRYLKVDTSFLQMILKMFPWKIEDSFWLCMISIKKSRKRRTNKSMKY